MISVFEHQKLYIGQQGFNLKHFEQIRDWQERNAYPYLRLQHRSVQFRHYVGILQIDNLQIEILPKTDHIHNGIHARKVLLEMLNYTQKIPLHSSGIVRLSTEKGNLFELLIRVFLEEVEILIQQGLRATYTQQAAILQHWRGRVDFAKQMRSAAIRPQDCHTVHQVFEREHPVYQWIFKALELLTRHIFIDQELKKKANRLYQAFPHQKNPNTNKLEVLPNDRAWKRFQYALRWAQFIVLKYQPKWESGEAPILAILWDMNDLFEQFIYRTLIDASRKETNVLVKRHLNSQFWEEKKLIPDFYIQIGEEVFILDAKWKLIHGHQAQDQDLRQIFTYGQHFGAKHSVLIYPKYHGKQINHQAVFRTKDSNQAQGHLFFASLVHQESQRLNKELGRTILDYLEALKYKKLD